MFVGHYSVAFAARPAAQRVPLWVWFVGVQWLDVVWAVLVLAGIEKGRVVPGFTEASPLDLYFMPYTHGLPGSLLLSLLFGATVAFVMGADRVRIFAVAALASFSHWVLDLIVHVPDLPLYDDQFKVGFGLWRHRALSFSLELALLGLGLWIYARTTPTHLQAGPDRRPNRRAGRLAGVRQLRAAAGDDRGNGRIGARPLRASCRARGLG